MPEGQRDRAATVPIQWCFAEMRKTLYIPKRYLKGMGAPWSFGICVTSWRSRRRAALLWRPRSACKIKPSHYLDNFATGISLVASTRGITLLPSYVEPLLPWSVVSRKLKGKTPTIDLAVGYRADNPSPVLKTFLGGIEQLIAAGPAGARNSRQPK